MNRIRIQLILIAAIGLIAYFMVSCSGRTRFTTEQIRHIGFFDFWTGLRIPDDAKIIRSHYSAFLDRTFYIVFECSLEEIDALYSKPPFTGTWKKGPIPMESCAGAIFGEGYAIDGWGHGEVFGDQKAIDLVKSKEIKYDTKGSHIDGEELELMIIDNNKVWFCSSTK